MGDQNAVVKPVCPHCGHSGWGYLDKFAKATGTSTCISCEGRFYYERVEKVEYVTRKVGIDV